MSRDRMNWKWVDGVQVVVFTRFVTDGLYKVKIMISRTNVPDNPTTTPWATPWKTGKVVQCKSHETAANSVYRYVKQWFGQHGNPCVGPPREVLS